LKRLAVPRRMIKFSFLLSEEERQRWAEIRVLKNLPLLPCKKEWLWLEYLPWSLYEHQIIPATCGFSRARVVMYLVLYILPAKKCLFQQCATLDII
jgi:hypothetical protein